MGNLTTLETYAPKTAIDELAVGEHSVFEWRGLRINDRTQLETFIIDEPTGFGDADIVQSAEQNPQSHGETPNPSWYGGRTMTLSGYIRAGTYTQALRMRKTWERAFVDPSDDILKITRVEPTQVVWTNLHINPSAEGALTPWNADALMTLVQVTSGGKEDGSYLSFGRSTNSGALASVRTGLTRPDQAMSAAFWAKATWTGTVFFRMRSVNGGAWQSAETSVNMVAGEWTMVKIENFTPNTAGVGGELILEARGSAAIFTVGGNTMGVDVFTVVTGATAPPVPFSGETQDLNDALEGMWTGTEHASTSNFMRSYIMSPDVDITCRKVDKIEPGRITKSDDGTHKSTISVALRAHDPRYYGTERTLVIAPTAISDLGRAYDRGYDLGYTLPMDPSGSLAAGGNQRDAYNYGDFQAQPVLRFAGPMTGVTLTNLRNGQIMRLKYAILDGDYIEINIKTGEVYDSLGNNRFDYWDTTSDWLELEPAGDSDLPNSIVLGVSSFTPGTSLFTMTWRDTSISG